ncbi:MAG: hypothetical protein WC313_07985 [Candidatus Kapaibacterium sp.]
MKIFQDLLSKLELKAESINNFWLLIAVLAMVLRLLTVLIGNNYDIESWVIVGKSVSSGGIVYLDTFRYTTGPIWCYVLGAIYYIHSNLGLTDVMSFHFMVSLFLSIIDLISAYLISRYYKPIAGIIILLSPISILISGFHAQFEGFALLAALLSWIITSKSSPESKNHILSALLIGVSLIIKHILVFYPLWLFLSSRNISFRNRMIYAIVPYSLFLIAFVPFMIEPQVRESVINHVFKYESAIGSSLLGLLLSPIPDLIMKDILGVIPVFSGMKFFFFIGMFITGIIVARRNFSMTFFFYLISMIVMTPAMADQYLVIPMAACALFIKHYEIRYYLLFSSLYLIFITPNNIGPHFVPQLIEGAKNLFSSLSNMNSSDLFAVAGIPALPDSVSQVTSKYDSSETLIFMKEIAKKVLFLAYPFIQLWLLLFYIKYIVGKHKINSY